MRFYLDHRPAVRSFLDGLTLSRLGRISLFYTLNALRTVADAERLDPANRVGPYFVFRRAFREKGRLVPIRFVVDDGPAAYGVLRLVYADLP